MMRLAAILHLVPSQAVGDAELERIQRIRDETKRILDRIEAKIDRMLLAKETVR